MHPIPPNITACKVAVANTKLAYDKLYTYQVPFDFVETARIGCRVLVPFGSGNRRQMGIIIEICENFDDLNISKIKPIISLLDNEPILSPELIKLSEYIADTTFCTRYAAAKIMLPTGINMRIKSTLKAAEGINANAITSLPTDEQRILEILMNSKAEVEISRLAKIVNLSEDSPAFKNLLAQNLIIKSDLATQNINDANLKMAEIIKNSPILASKLTEKQQLVVNFLQENDATAVKEICYFTGASTAIVSNLAKKGAVNIFEMPTFRNPYENAAITDFSEIILTDEQQKAYDEMVANFEKGGGSASLLHGITGSGKTHIYLKLIDYFLKINREIIFMVPEIALTTQTLEKFHKRYGGKIAIFHSAMTLSQRMDEYKRVKQGIAKIAIGTRSAVFAPFSNLGLIILDEEHEHTYKSESSPRYHARDVARFRMAFNKGLLLLASATPSIESYSRAKAGAYNLHTLKNRYNNAVLPQVIIADTKEDLQKGNIGEIGAILKNALQETLNNGKQAILLINRRGYNTFVSCQKCGETLKCPNCSISLTFHAKNRRNMCHYCAYSADFSEICSECNSNSMRYAGAGTQKVEDELQQMFAGAKILRLDADSSYTRLHFEQNLKAFENREYDILLGTQMVAKGLNFPDVTLVGVLNADNSMHSADYKSYERTFSLLTQVAGRAGRFSDPGMAIIQTANPEDNIFNLAKNQDYEAFYSEEIAMRKLMTYPPFCDIGMIVFQDENQAMAQKSAENFTKILQTTLAKHPEIKYMILGPTAAIIPKVNHKYRYRLILKCKNSRELRNLLRDCIKTAKRDPKFKNSHIYAVFNPENII